MTNIDDTIPELPEGELAGYTWTFYAAAADPVYCIGQFVDRHGYAPERTWRLTYDGKPRYLVLGPVMLRPVQVLGGGVVAESGESITWDDVLQGIDRDRRMGRRDDDPLMEGVPV